MPQAQGINKVLSFKKQTALGAPASGSGGQRLRRRTATFTNPTDTYENDEIVSHQQTTGANIGPAKPQGRIEGLLSPGTYATLLQSLLRRDFSAVTAATGLSLTVAGPGPTWTLTRGAGDFLAGGVKIGMVVRLTAGAFNVANLNKNLLVVNATATVLTVKPLNGVALVPEGPVATATLTVPGKVTFAPTAGHTNDFYTFEQFFADLAKSETFEDTQVAQADIQVPATGNVGVSIDLISLKRTRGNVQVLTAPAAETSTGVLQSVNGAVIINGGLAGGITSAQVTVTGNVTHADAELGSNRVDDVQRGRIVVSGQFTAKFTGTALQDLKDTAATTTLALTVCENGLASSGFVSLILPAVKLTSDDADDGEKGIIRTYQFRAEYYGAGGANQALEQTVFEIQDSAA